VRYTNEAPLAELRGALAALGLARRAQANEPEDHVAALCDTMRHLIVRPGRHIAAQRSFFEKWLWPPAQPLCNAIDHAPSTYFYRFVSRFTRDFLSLEHSAFDLT
jgi:TorA maturation chaperone TorD